MDLIDRQSVLKAIDDYERLSAVSQTVRNMTSLKEIVQQLPSVQPKRTEKRTETHACDCISRQAVLDVLDALDITDGVGISSIACNLQEKAIRGIRMLPSAQPERKRGEWTYDNACPFCGFQPWYERDIHTLSYCPNCGADMRGERNEEHDIRFMYGSGHISPCYT